MKTTMSPDRAAVGNYDLQPLRRLTRAGDILTEIMGTILVEAEEGRLTERHANATRDAILSWHGLVAQEFPEGRP